MGRFVTGRRAAAAAIALFVALAAAESAVAQAPNALSETYSDWVVRCETPDGGERRCWMVQTLRRSEDGERILQLEFTIVDGETRMVMLAPFGLLLPSGVRLSVDGGAQETIPFRTCLPAGCLVESEPDDNLLASLRRGRTLSVGFDVAQTEAPIALEVSLSGFTAAHDRLRNLRDG